MGMIKTPIAAFIIFLTLAFFSSVSASDNPTKDGVAKGVDLAKFAGRWYQIAAIPAPFQPPNGKDTRANYTLNSNGTLTVLNEVWVRGTRRSIQGIAYKANPSNDEAKFKVRFQSVPFAGDYWILDVDEKYEHTLVSGGPSKLFLWILSRKTEMEAVVYEKLVKKAVDLGYPVILLVKTEHNEIPPSSAELSGRRLVDKLID